MKFGSKIYIFQVSMRGLQKQWWQCWDCGLVFLVLTFFWSFKLFLSLAGASVPPTRTITTSRAEACEYCANIVLLILTNICFNVAASSWKFAVQLWTYIDVFSLLWISAAVCSASDECHMCREVDPGTPNTGSSHDRRDYVQKGRNQTKKTTSLTCACWWHYMYLLSPSLMALD